MWHVSSRSGVATLRTAIHLLLTYLPKMASNERCLSVESRDEHTSRRLEVDDRRVWDDHRDQWRSRRW